MCICGYCKYHNELCYKSPICSMVVVWSCCHDVLLLRRFSIVHIITSYVIKLLRQYVFFFSSLGEVLVWFNIEDVVPRWEGSITTPVKISCNKS